jgi:molybdate transport system substrate-binding protein
MRSVVGRLFLVLTIVALCVTLAHGADLNLSVAASLKEVVTELSDNFANTNGGVTVRSNFGASGMLAKQIENGAPVDLFFSANLEWMDYLEKKKLIDEKNVSIFAYNLLVFVGKPGLKVSRLQDVATLDKIAIGSPESVPAGQYAMDAFKKAGIDKKLEGKLIMAKDVRACLTYADRGEADGAFVYKTDAEEMAKNVKTLFTVPQDLYPRVTYPVGLTVTGSEKAVAAAFFKYLQSGEARVVLEKHGFVVR